MQLREQSLSKLPWPHLSVVLQASPEICNARIAKRSRDCESSIPVAYLELLRDGHQTFLSDMAALPSKMICMDWSTFGTAEQVGGPAARSHIHPRPPFVPSRLRRWAFRGGGGLSRGAGDSPLAPFASISGVQVMDVITNTSVAPWTDALCDTVLLMAQTELAQDRVLHVPDTPPEVQATVAPQPSLRGGLHTTTLGPLAPSRSPSGQVSPLSPRC